MLLLDFLVPHHCAFCGCACAGSEKSICTGCFSDLPWKSKPLSPLPGVFEERIALLRYEFPVDAALKALKFHRKLYYAPAFVQVLLQAVPVFPDDLDAVLAVPLHWRRETHRGFNQAIELAGPVSKHVELPLIRGVRRQKATMFQSGLRAAARSKNLQQAFRARKKLGYRHVLIIDDVTTTGATLTQLAKTIQQAGVEKVSALTVAEAQ